MTQTEFKQRLARGLHRLPADRRREIEEDIDAHFAEGLADGMGEAKLCEMLGSPEALAKEYTMESVVGRAQAKPSVSNAFRVIWAGLGLGMLNLIIGLPIILSVFAGWFAFAAAAIGCLVGGVAAIVAVPLYWIPWIQELVYIEFPALTFVGGIAVVAAGGLLAIFSAWLGRILVGGLLKYVGIHRDILVGRNKAS